MRLARSGDVLVPRSFMVQERQASEVQDEDEQYIAQATALAARMLGVK